jgi:abortive infection bacteriophage resistance protein
MDMFKNTKKFITIFLFRYLYDNETDSADNWTDFHEVYKYLQDNKHSNEFIMNEYHRAMKERNRNMEF